jgi:hypothetical protein
MIIEMIMGMIIEMIMEITLEVLMEIIIQMILEVTMEMIKIISTLNKVILIDKAIHLIKVNIKTYNKTIDHYI